MGKGFNNYMTKKFFHPASKDNIKRVWMAQQKTTYEKKKQEDLMNQYQKEQEMLSNRALLGDEKAKLGLSFIYDAPPGLRKKEQEDEGEQEIKFEWQRKYNAPREAYAKDDETIRDQPFGIEVRNVRCIKCRQWGHVNTDKICPLFGRNLTAEPPQPENTTASLLEGLKDEGFRMKKSIVGRLIGGEDSKEFDSDDDPEAQFLKSLTPKQKKKLLKKLDKLQAKGKMKKKKKDKKRKNDKKSRKSSSSSDSDSSDSEDGARKQGKKTHKRPVDHSDSMDSDSDRPGARAVRKKDFGRNERRGPPPRERRSRSPLMRGYRGSEPSRRRPESTTTRRDSSSDDGPRNRRYKDVRVKQEKPDPADETSTIRGRKYQDDKRRDQSRDRRRERSADKKHRRKDRSSSSSEEESGPRRDISKNSRKERSTDRKNKRKEQSCSSSDDEMSSRRNNVMKNIKKEHSAERKHKRKDQSSSSSEDEMASRKNNISKSKKERSVDRKHKRKGQTPRLSEDEEIASNTRKDRNRSDQREKYSEFKSSKERSLKNYERETRQESFRDERRDRRDDRGDQRDRRDDRGDKRDRRDDRGDQRDRRNGGEHRDRYDRRDK